jgi:hypothetical protein
MRFSDYRPRHVLCILGKKRDFFELVSSMQLAINEFADGFEVDAEFSQGVPDERMAEAFYASWDRVHENAWDDADSIAVRDHGCVIYVLGPHMGSENAVEISAVALRLIIHALDHGATAVKGESAGVAHGVTRWRQIGRAAETLSDRRVLARLCRLAFSRRPLCDDDSFLSVGFHLIGLPEVFVSRALAEDELELTAIIDDIAEELYIHGVDKTLALHGAILLPVDGYDEDELKYNPYGAVHVRSFDKVEIQDVSSERPTFFS